MNQHGCFFLDSTLDFDRLLEVLLAKVQGLLDAERATLFLFDDDGATLESTVVRGGAISPIRLRLGQGIAGWVAESGATVNLPDAYADPRFNQEIDQRSGFRTRSILCMPMPDHRGRVIGVVQALNRRGRPFDAEDEALLGTVAAHAGIAVENGKLYRALNQRIAELDLLVELEHEAAASLDLDELLDRLLARTMQLTDAEGGSVRLRSGESWARPGDKQLGAPARSVMAAPLYAPGAKEAASLGTIELVGKRSGEFSEADVKVLRLIASQAARAIVLARAREERLKEGRLAAIGQMMSGVVHDLKTPMTIASGYTQLMALSPDAATRAEHAEIILRQVDLMAAMAREVLLFARGESHLLVRRVPISGFLAEVTRQLERELAQQQITLAIEACYDGLACFDELKMFRLVQNLARNAAQAMAPGGTFGIRVEAAGGELRMSFSDSGRGIPESMRGRLFEAFATAGKADGTGLGLAIVKKIVDDHQGRIDYETRAGLGTTFHLSLPLERPGLSCDSR